MLLLATMVVVSGCAMTATTEQMQNLATKTQQVPMGFVFDAVESGICRELSTHQLQGRAGATVGHDLQMLAEEVDSVVTYNGGNSYAMNEWQWITVDAWGSTAPLVRISVLDCPASSTAIESEPSA